MSQTFGASLREARERKGVSLRQIAAATKISVAALESLERNEFSKLPGGIFSRSFVRSYAIEVGLDPDEAVHAFLEQFSGDAPPRAAAHGPDPATAPAEIPRGSSRPPRPSTPSEVTEELDFGSRQRIASIVLKLALVSVPIAGLIIYFGARGAAPESPAASAAAPPQGVVSPPSPHAEPAAPERPAESAPSPIAEAAAPAPVDEPAIVIEITPSADCWAKLTADGTVVLSRVLIAGEHARQEFRDAAVLQVGDAAACEISIDGRPTRPLGAARQVREIRITRDNYAALLR
jgi:cytoskeletal protein RodZ